MRIGIDAAVIGSIEQQKRLDVISNNLANANTPGFKKDNVHFSDFVYETSYTQMNEGQIHFTGGSLDVALEGDGYLQVRAEGETLFTRAGNLTLDANNTLVTRDGYPVMGQNGPVQVPDSNIRIEKDGQVFDDEENLVGSLTVVRFPQGTRLEKVDNSYFRPAGPKAVPLPAEECRVRQGALEDSNFTVVEEMARMIDTMRAFEAYQKILQFNSQQDTALINRLTS